MILRPSRRPQKLRCLFPSNPAKKQKPVYSYGLTPPCNAPIQQVKEGDTTRLRTPVILHTDRLPLEPIKDRLPVKGEHHVADGHW